MHGLSPTNLFCLCDLWNLWSFGGQAQGVLKGSSVICGILGQLWRPPKFWFDILAQEFAGTLQFMHHELRSQKPRTNARHVEILWFGLELWKLRKHSFLYYFLHSCLKIRKCILPVSLVYVGPLLFERFRFDNFTSGTTKSAKTRDVSQICPLSRDITGMWGQPASPGWCLM